VSDNSDDVSPTDSWTKPSCSQNIKQNERKSSWSKKPRHGHYTSDSFSSSSSSGCSTSPRQLFSRMAHSSSSSNHQHNDYQSQQNFNSQSNSNNNNHYNHHNHHHHSHFNNYRHKKQTNNQANLYNRFTHANHGSNSSIHNSNENQLLNIHQASSTNISLTANSPAIIENSNNFDVNLFFLWLN
jgi:hypothetical protein